LLTCTETKNKLIEFLADSWQAQSRRQKLVGITMFVASQQQCFTTDTCEEVNNLATSQEEADTPLFLHAQHAALTHQSLCHFGR